MMNQDLERFWTAHRRRRFVREARAADREDLVPKILDASGAFLRRNVVHNVNQIDWPEPKPKVPKPKPQLVSETRVNATKQAGR